MRQFRYAYDTKNQLQMEKLRVRAEIAKNPPGLNQTYLVRELSEIDQLLREDPQIRKIPGYRNTLIEHNLKLIIKVASYYKDKGLGIDDLIQEGALGFIRAIEKFNPNEGVKLGTYATWWIRQKITRALSNKTRIIRLPVHVTADVTKVLKFVREHRLDVDEEYIPIISEGLGISEEKIKEIFGYIMSFSPVNQIVTMPYDMTSDSDEPQDTFVAMMDAHCCDNNMIDHRLEAERLKFDLNQSLMEISLEEKKLLIYKFGLGEHPQTSYVELEKLMGREGHSCKNGKTAVQKAIYKLLDNILQDNPV